MKKKLPIAIAPVVRAVVAAAVANQRLWERIGEIAEDIRLTSRRA